MFAVPSTLEFLRVPKPKALPMGGLIELKGLDAVVLGTLKARLSINDTMLSTLLGTPTRTFQRHKTGDSTLKPAQVDAALRIGRVSAEAFDVFGDPDRAVGWLKQKHPLLGKAPIELLGSDAGAQAVMDELTRIRWGDLA